MEPPEYADDLAEALRGAHERELRLFARYPNRMETKPSHTRNFPAHAVAYTDVIEWIMRSLDAIEDSSYSDFGWSFLFAVDETPCRIRWTKSGLKLDLYPSGSPRVTDSERNAISIERQVLSAARQVHRRVIAPRVIMQIDHNRVTVINQYARYRGMVDFFLAEIQRQPPEQRSEVLPGAKLDEYMSSLFKEAVLEPARRGREQAYRATALIGGYFSYLQHCFVVLSSFSPRATTEGFSVQRLLKEEWAEQFDHAFPSPQSPRIAQLKSDIKVLATEFRNPLLHGGGGRPEDGLIVEWSSGQNSMVFQDERPTDLYMLLRPALTEDQVEDLISRISRIDTLLEDHPFFEWYRSGLPADFRQERVHRALAVMGSGRVREFISQSSEEYDRIINWD